MTIHEHCFDIALSHSLLSSGVLVRLVQALGSAEAVWQASDSQLKAHLEKDQLEKLQAAKSRWVPENLAESYKQMGVQVLAWRDPAFPTLLRETHDPPFLLYVRGNIQALSQKGLAVVGTRRCTGYGLEAVHTLIEQIASEAPCIVSGLAGGIDTAAHQSALKHGLATVAVFGTPIDMIYPKGNQALADAIVAQGGALVSEYPIGMPADKFTFPKRNRIIAGLAEGVLVVEGSRKSGALITARFALEENRQVMAVPGSIFSEGSIGPNWLIQAGGVAIQNGKDILATLGWAETPVQGSLLAPKKQENPEPAVLNLLSEEERQVYEGLGDKAVNIDELLTTLPALSFSQVQTAITMLEIQGLITALPGAKFAKAHAPVCV